MNGTHQIFEQRKLVCCIRRGQLSNFIALGIDLQVGMGNRMSVVHDQAVMNTHSRSLTIASRGFPVHSLIILLISRPRLERAVEASNTKSSYGRSATRTD